MIIRVKPMQRSQYAIISINTNVDNTVTIWS